jgi:hypothetical protein
VVEELHCTLDEELMGLHSGARRLSREEWEALSTAVFERDGWTCLAPTLDPEAGPCHDVNGLAVSPIELQLQKRMSLVRMVLTLQHLQIAGTTEHDLQHLLTLCWGHHLGHGERGGRIWAKQKAAAQAQRDHLAKLYPELAA